MAPHHYAYVVRRPGGRGQHWRAHLINERGEAMCGRRLDDRWELAIMTRRQVCRYCLNARRRAMEPKLLRAAETDPAI